MDKKPKTKGPPAETERFLDDLRRRGALNPEHKEEFNRLLDDILPPTPPATPEKK